MPQQRGPGLSLAEWLVLCLASEGPTHCFAIAGLLTDDGSLGRVWHVRKAVVYRAAQRLEQLGLIMMASDKQPSSLGPARVPLWATPEGRQAAEVWLRQPACHARDVRSELLLKLALLDRAGADPRELLRAQRRQLAPVASALAGQIPATAGFDQVLLSVRYRRPVPLDVPLRIWGRVTGTGGRRVSAVGGITTAAEPDVPLVEAEARFARLRLDQARRLFSRPGQP